MRSEEYVRPPIVPSETASTAAAAWRYRVVALVLLAVTVTLFVLLFLHFSNVTGGEDPGLGGALRPVRGL